MLQNKTEARDERASAESVVDECDDWKELTA
jgi:hypothetical protein